MSLDEERQENLLRFGHRARIWALLHLNPEQFFTLEEIAQRTGLKPGTVEQGLKFVRQLPLIQASITYEKGRRIVRYGFVPVLPRSA